MNELIPRNVTGLPAPTKALQSMAKPVSAFVIHHTVTPLTSNPYSDIKRVTNYSKYIDIPYQFLTHPELLGDAMMGRFLNGRPALGAHTGGFNSKALGLARIGNYMTGNLDNDVLLAGEVFAMLLSIRNGWLTPQFTLYGHRSAPGQATACPGDILFSKIVHIKDLVDLGQGIQIPTTPITQTPQTPLSSAPAYPMLLLKGTKGGYVKQAQNQLLALGYALPRYGADGAFGDETFNAVVEFQRDHGLGVDGKIGRNTWGALFSTTAKNLVIPFTLPSGHYYGKYWQRTANHSGRIEKDRPAIRLIQQKLGLYADGGFGDNTHNAVVNYQRTRGLDVDGLVGINTWTKMFS